jgi:hypothetical protein
MSIRSPPDGESPPPNPPGASRESNRVTVPPSVGVVPSPSLPFCPCHRNANPHAARSPPHSIAIASELSRSWVPDVQQTPTPGWTQQPWQRQGGPNRHGKRTQTWKAVFAKLPFKHTHTSSCRTPCRLSNPPSLTHAAPSYPFCLHRHSQ